MSKSGGDDLLKEEKDTIIPTLYSFGKDEASRGSIEVANTYRIQLTSLHMFANTLGYIYSEDNEYDGGLWVKSTNFTEEGKRIKTDKMFVGSTNMIKWHNTSFNTLGVKQGEREVIALHNQVKGLAREFGIDLK